MEAQPSVLKTLNEGEFLAVRDRAHDLCEKDRDYGVIRQLLISAASLYALARYRLQRQCEQDGHPWANGTEEMILSLSREIARVTPLQIPRLMGELQNLWLPLMAEITEEHNQEVKEASLKAMRKRSESAVSVLFGSNPMELTRGSVTLFVGNAAQVAAAINAVRLPENNPDGMLRLRLGNFNLVGENGIVAQTQWQGVSDSRKAWQQLMRLHGAGGRDLLVLDDLVVLGDNSNSTRPKARLAESALRYPRNWARDNALAIVCGLATDDVADAKRVLGSFVTVIEVQSNE